MRLYTLTGAAQVADVEHGTFEADDVGAFELPEELAARLHGFHIGGKPAWENDAEREKRINAEELERFRDPATLLAAVKEMAGNQGALAAALAGLLGSANTAPAAPADPPPGPEAPAKQTKPKKAAADPATPAT